MPESVLLTPKLRRRNWRWLCAAAGILILTGAVFAVYLRVVGAPFIFDDVESIVNNRSIRELWPLWGDAPSSGPLRPDVGTPMSARPLVNLSLAVNYHFGQLDPTGYRVFDIVVHLLSALLLWLVVGRILRLEHFHGRFDRSAGPLGFSVALVWAVHPLATEAVAYVTQRTELMMAFFYLATVYASLRYWAALGVRGRAAWLAVAAAACVLGAFSKEMIASAPAVVLLLERTLIAGSFKSALRRSWPLYLALTPCWVVLVAINFHGPRTPLAGFGLGVSATAWWLTQTKVLFLYLKLVVWPWPLVIHYDMPYLQTLGQAWPWLLGVGMLCAAAVWLLWRHSAIGFILVSVVAILSPTLVVPLVGEIAVERRMYLPLAALVPLAVVGGWIVLERLAGRLAPALGVAAVAVLAGVLALVGSRRLAAYESELMIWQDAAVHQPDNPFVHVSLGILLNKAGRNEQGTRHLERAVQLAPKMSLAQFSLARAYDEAGRSADAIDHYRAALRASGDHAPTHNNLGRLLNDQGKYAEAIAHFERALREEPNFSAAHNNLAIARLYTGDLPRAIQHFEEALRLRPTFEGYTNLASAYAMAGRRADALAAAEQGARMARAEGQDALVEQLEKAIDALRREAAPSP